jgi:hypothetical protein
MSATRDCRVRIHAVVATIVLLAAVAPARAANEWSIDAMLGAAHNVSTPLAVRQNGEPAIELDARWETRSFDPPLYNAVRIARWRDDPALAVSLVHHKLHLRDRPPEIESFAISHGYNLLTLERFWSRRWLVWGLGAGAVIAHPENTVRGRSLDESRGFMRSGYYVAGPSASLIGAGRWPVGERAALGLEARLSGSHARVPVVEGHARVPNLALHLAAALGVRI